MHRMFLKEAGEVAEDEMIGKADMREFFMDILLTLKILNHMNVFKY